MNWISGPHPPVWARAWLRRPSQVRQVWGAGLAGVGGVQHRRDPALAHLLDGLGPFDAGGQLAMEVVAEDAVKRCRTARRRGLAGVALVTVGDRREHDVSGVLARQRRLVAIVAADRGVSLVPELGLLQPRLRNLVLADGEELGGFTGARLDVRMALAAVAAFLKLAQRLDAATRSSRRKARPCRQTSGAWRRAPEERHRSVPRRYHRGDDHRCHLPVAPRACPRVSRPRRAWPLRPRPHDVGDPRRIPRRAFHLQLGGVGGLETAEARRR